MADKEIIEEEVVTKSETKTTPVRPVSIAEARRKRRSLIALLTLLGIVILGLLISAAVLAFVGFSKEDTSNTPGTMGFSSQNRGYSRLSGNTGYGYGTGTQTSVSGGSVQTTVYSYLTGVVTAVNSDSIVVAGNGKTTTIKTNSSTVYDNSTKPAVNDTVTVAGTTSDSTTTATEIAVNNN